MGGPAALGRVLESGLGSLPDALGRRTAAEDKPAATADDASSPSPGKGDKHANGVRTVMQGVNKKCQVIQK